MATLYQRLHRLGPSGYDTVWLETSSKLVIRPNGHSVEEDLSALTDTVSLVAPKILTNIPTMLEPGRIAVIGEDVYIGNTAGTPVLVGTPNSQFDIVDI